MQKYSVVAVLGFLLCMPFGYAQPAAAEIDTNSNNSVQAVGQVFIVQSPQLGLLRAAQKPIVSQVTCGVATGGSTALVQQTVDVEALSACNTLVLGHVLEMPALAVSESPAQSLGFVVLPPVQRIVSPALAPGSSEAQSLALVVPASTAGSRAIVLVTPYLVRSGVRMHVLVRQSSKTLAQLGFMLC